MDKGMKTRWISLYVENQVGVLSKISGLFSGKSYNLDSLTVGTTEDPTVSRMTIATVSDDETFEQIKKQLNRMVEVIKVIDFTDVFVRMKEILYVKVRKCSPADKVELFQIAETFKARVIDYGKDSLLLEFIQTATKNDAVVKLIKEEFKNIEVVRGGSVGIESISMMERRYPASPLLSVDQIVLKSRKMFIWKDQAAAVQSAAVIDQTVIYCRKHIHIQFGQFQSEKLHPPLISLIKINAFPFRNSISSDSFTLLLFLISKMIGRSDFRYVIHCLCTKLNLHIRP